MAKVQEFYKGRRKRKNYAIVPFIVLLLLISLILVFFYGMQKYAVITKDGVSVEFPLLADENVKVDSTGHEIRTLEQTNVDIVFQNADYSKIEATAGGDLFGIRAIFIPAQNITRSEIAAYAARLVSGNALLMEMKPRSGIPMWHTENVIAQKYGIAPNSPEADSMQEYVSMIKAQGIYLAAQISCCIDETIPLYTAEYSMQTTTRGMYKDERGTYLDPYNLELRQSVTEMCRELFEMGFDEVILADVIHPVSEVDADGEPREIFVYSREISTERSPINAVCGFAVNVAESLRDVDGVLSIYVDSRTALVKPDTLTGQDAELFLKVYDRAYLKTDKYAYPFNVEDVKPSVHKGNVFDRLVPVVENYIPSDNTSWILIDVEED